MVRRILLISIGLVFCLQISITQEGITFHPPVDHPIILAGSFGEIRSTHFHAGLDIKPSSNLTGDSIRCSELGYVSRIKIQRSGYGRAVYVDHPNGYTTVYAHLQTFSPQLEAAVLANQRNAQSYEIDIYPAPGEFIIPKSGFIGKMGDSGRSYGKHLHYEIRKTVSEHPINPMLFGIGPLDNIPPTITGIAIHGVTKEGRPTIKKRFGQALPPVIKLPALQMGVALAGFDQMNGASNKNGIFEMALFVDDSLYYHQKLDEVSFDEMNQIKAHIDYEDKINIKSTYARMYKVPGNNLSIIDSIRNNGIIPIYKDHPRTIKIKIRDLNGNVTTASTKVIREERLLPLEEDEAYNLLAIYDQEHTFNMSPLLISIPSFSLSQTEQLTFSHHQTKGNDAYQIGRESIALLKNIDLALSITNSTISKKDKTSLMKYENGKYVDYGRTITKDTLYTSIGSLGNYALVEDLSPPTIAPASYPKSINGYYTFIVQDNIVTKGRAKMLTYDVYINGTWVPCEYKETIKTLYVPVGQSGDNIQIIAQDQYNNVNKWTSNKG